MATSQRRPAGGGPGPSATGNPNRDHGAPFPTTVLSPHWRRPSDAIRGPHAHGTTLIPPIDPSGMISPPMIVDPEDEDEEVKELFSGVFHITTTSSEPDYHEPWATFSSNKSNGTGFAIDRQRRWIMTNYHVIADASLIQVHKNEDFKMYRAKVLCSDEGSDLALITVEDNKFWTDDVKTINFQKNDDYKLNTPVHVLGHPLGDKNVSITQGVISKYQCIAYSQQGTIPLPAIHVSAAINGGNSGGPVLNAKTNECLGVAFAAYSSSDDVQNVGLVIPTIIVKRFVTDYLTFGEFTGYFHVGFNYQTLESPALRNALSVPDSVSGVLVTEVFPDICGDGLVQLNDVVMTLDGHDIGDDGTIKFRKGERQAFQFLLCQKSRNAKLELTLLRSGDKHTVSWTLTRAPTQLVPHKPRLEYFIIGGLAFIPLSAQSEAPASLSPQLEKKLTTKDDQVIILAEIISHEVNEGYQLPAAADAQGQFDIPARLVSFNSTEVRNIKHLTELVEACKDNWMKFQFDDPQLRLVILDTKKAVSATREILLQNNIASAKPRHHPQHRRQQQHQQQSKQKGDHRDGQQPQQPPVQQRPAHAHDVNGDARTHDAGASGSSGIDATGAFVPVDAHGGDGSGGGGGGEGGEGRRKGKRGGGRGKKDRRQRAESGDSVAHPETDHAGPPGIVLINNGNSGSGGGQDGGARGAGVGDGGTGGSGRGDAAPPAADGPSHSQGAQGNSSSQQKRRGKKDRREPRGSGERARDGGSGAQQASDALPHAPTAQPVAVDNGGGESGGGGGATQSPPAPDGEHPYEARNGAGGGRERGRGRNRGRRDRKQKATDASSADAHQPSGGAGYGTQQQVAVGGDGGSGWGSHGACPHADHSAATPPPPQPSSQQQQQQQQPPQQVPHNAGGVGDQPPLPSRKRALPGDRPLARRSQSASPTPQMGAAAAKGTQGSSEGRSSSVSPRTVPPPSSTSSSLPPPSSAPASS